MLHALQVSSLLTSFPTSKAVSPTLLPAKPLSSTLVLQEPPVDVGAGNPCLPRFASKNSDITGDVPNNSD
jgi:hypothetical protein